jgi:hypothetical protein
VPSITVGNGPSCSADLGPGDVFSARAAGAQLLRWPSQNMTQFRSDRCIGATQLVNSSTSIIKGKTVARR